MPERYNNTICREHSGIVAKVEALEKDVKKLWEKWDAMAKIVLGVFITLSLNLICVVLLLIRTMK